MKITWFGHSCFRVETGGSVLLIDPFLKGNPTFEKSGIVRRQRVSLRSSTVTMPALFRPGLEMV